jgi:amidase
VDAADLPRTTARELLQLLRRREVSARELLDVHVLHLEQCNDAVNAVVSLDVDRARVTARVVDQQLARGRLVGPLHGLPMTVKDTFETAGLRTVAGATLLRDHVPSQDAVAVARLKDAGAVVFGKTNTPALASDWQTSNEVFGTTNNPWDTSRTAGGSSGGSAAALAAGMTPLELGSDIGGSIRMPSAMCGVVGHKPTFGIVPQRGHIPGPPGSLSHPDLGVAGPLGRSVEDVALALDTLVGPIEPQSRGWRLELPPPGKRGLRSWRLASLVDDTGLPADRSVRQSLGGVIEQLAAEGCRVERRPRAPVDHDELADLYATLLRPVVGEDRALTHVQWLAANERRLQLMEEVEDFFERYDALLMPAFPTVAFPHDLRPSEQRTLTVDGQQLPYAATALAWAGLATVMHLPATVLPVATVVVDGTTLPVGLQVVGPYLGDRTTLAVAADIERVVGRFTPPPS